MSRPEEDLNNSKDCRFIMNYLFENNLSLQSLNLSELKKESDILLYKLQKLSKDPVDKSKSEESNAGGKYFSNILSSSLPTDIVSHWKRKRRVSRVVELKSDLSDRIIRCLDTLKSRFESSANGLIQISALCKNAKLNRINNLMSEHEANLDRLDTDVSSVYECLRKVEKELKKVVAAVNFGKEILINKNGKHTLVRKGAFLNSTMVMEAELLSSDKDTSSISSDSVSESDQERGAGMEVEFNMDAITDEWMDNMREARNAQTDHRNEWEVEVSLDITPPSSTVSDVTTTAIATTVTSSTNINDSPPPRPSGNDQLQPTNFVTADTGNVISFTKSDKVYGKNGNKLDKIISKSKKSSSKSFSPWSIAARFGIIPTTNKPVSVSSPVPIPGAVLHIEKEGELPMPVTTARSPDSSQNIKVKDAFSPPISATNMGHAMPGSEVKITSASTSRTESTSPVDLELPKDSLLQEIMNKSQELSSLRVKLKELLNTLQEDQHFEMQMLEYLKEIKMNMKKMLIFAYKILPYLEIADKDIPIHSILPPSEVHHLGKAVGMPVHPAARKLFPLAYAGASSAVSSVEHSPSHTLMNTNNNSFDSTVLEYVNIEELDDGEQSCASSLGSTWSRPILPRVKPTFGERELSLSSVPEVMRSSEKPAEGIAEKPSVTIDETLLQLLESIHYTVKYEFVLIPSIRPDTLLVNELGLDVMFNRHTNGMKSEYEIGSHLGDRLSDISDRRSVGSVDILSRTSTAESLKGFKGMLKNPLKMFGKPSNLTSAALESRAESYRIDPPIARSRSGSLSEAKPKLPEKKKESLSRQPSLASLSSSPPTHATVTEKFRHLNISSNKPYEKRKLRSNSTQNQDGYVDYYQFLNNIKRFPTAHPTVSLTSSDDGKPISIEQPVLTRGNSLDQSVGKMSSLSSLSSLSTGDELSGIADMNPSVADYYHIEIPQIDTDAETVGITVTLIALKNLLEISVDELAAFVMLNHLKVYTDKVYEKVLNTSSDPPDFVME